jgi:hypothetical protein
LIAPHGAKSNPTKADTITTTPDQDRLVRIRTFNDQLRQNFALAPHHVTRRFKVLFTPGCRSLNDAGFAELVRTVSTFTDFGTDNDPYGEHDFGAVTIAGTRFFWKIDTYDVALTFGSVDPSNPNVTVRVLT